MLFSSLQYLTASKTLFHPESKKISNDQELIQSDPTSSNLQSSWLVDVTYCLSLLSVKWVYTSQNIHTMQLTYIWFWFYVDNPCRHIEASNLHSFIDSCLFWQQTPVTNTDSIWAASSEFGTYRLCEQRRFRRACASAQSRQNLRCSLIQAVSQEESSDRKPDPWPLWMAGHAQLNLSWRNARRHKFAWRVSFYPSWVCSAITGSTIPSF